MQGCPNFTFCPCPIFDVAEVAEVLNKTVRSSRCFPWVLLLPNSVCYSIDLFIFKLLMSLMVGENENDEALLLCFVLSARLSSLIYFSSSFSVAWDICSAHRPVVFANSLCVCPGSFHICFYICNSTVRLVQREKECRTD